MYHSALFVHKSEKVPGSYAVKQLPSEDIFVTRQPAGNNRLPLHATVGAITATGSLETVSLEATIAIDIAGINLGLFYGNPSREHGLRVDVELDIFQGTVEMEINAFDEVWLYIRPDTGMVGNCEGNGKGEKGRNERDQGSATHMADLPSLACAPWT